MQDAEEVVRQVFRADPHPAGRCVVSGVGVSRRAPSGARELRSTKELSDMAPAIIRQELDGYHGMDSSSRHMMEDAVESYFGRCPPNSMSSCGDGASGRRVRSTGRERRGAGVSTS